MFKMSQLKRSETLIKRTCKKVGSALVPTVPMSVLVPVTTEHGGLAFIDERVYVIGILMYTDGKEYGILNAAAMIEMGTTDIAKTMVEGFDGEEVECYEFKYEKGQKIHPTNKVPKNAQLSYNFLNYLVLMGKTVPYFDMDDVDRIPDSIPRFCGFGLPEYGYTNHFVEMICRDPDDLQKPARLSKKAGFTTIPFSSVVLNVSSIIGKNRGNWLEDGITSGTLTTSTASTSFEKILRA